MAAPKSNGISNEYAHPLISERAIDEPRPLRVICVGAGISGILSAIRFPEYVPNLDLVLYEKNTSVGGTWFVNKYPGCACDIPAHVYQLSFESSVEWSQFYASSSEILKYWQRVAEKYDVKKYVKFRHEVTGATWDEALSQWRVRIRDLERDQDFEDLADFVMLDTGLLSTWKWPEIKGLHDFRSPVLHSANWDDSFDPSDKTIAVVGAGSSGIQIVPTLLPKVKSMDHYIRGRTWISDTFGSDVVRQRKGEDGNFAYTPQEIENWKKDPTSYIKYRKTLEIGLQGAFAVTHRGTGEHEEAWTTFETDMRTRLSKKPDIAQHLIPDFPPLCKRLTPGPGYLEALSQDKCRVVTSKISFVNETGITTEDGTHRPVDAIICATGFDVSLRGQFPIHGRGGQTLQDRRRARPETYLSMCVDGFPNLFQSMGPNSAVGAGNLILILEAVHEYIGQVLRKMASGNIKTVEPKRQAVKNFSDYCEAFFKRTNFSAECSSWYKWAPAGASDQERRNGLIAALWPGSSIHAAHALKAPRWEDFEMTFADENAFGWFGNGWALAERAKDVEGMSWYLNGTKFLHRGLEGEEELVSNGKILHNGDSELKKGELSSELPVPNGVPPT